MAEATLKELLEAGAHFGHQTQRWNPKMKPFIHSARGGVYIIDLEQTQKRLSEAEKFVRQTTAAGGTVLFVGTKRQAKAIVKNEAAAVGQPYVSERWLGGMLTNFKTIRQQVNRLKKLEAGLESGETQAKYNKKELLGITNEVERLNRIFGGIKQLDRLPAAVVVVDVPREGIAVAEAAKLGLPVVALVDTNANPDRIDYPIPANDDAIKSVALIVHRLAEAAAAGAQEHTAQAAAAVAEAPAAE